MKEVKKIFNENLEMLQSFGVEGPNTGVIWSYSSDSKSVKISCVKMSSKNNILVSKKTRFPQQF